MLNSDRPGVDRPTLDRAAEGWIDEAREVLKDERPEWTLYFNIPDRPARPRYEGQGQRLHELVQRLCIFVAELKPTQVGE